MGNFKEFVYDKGPFVFLGFVLLILTVGFVSDYRACRDNPSGESCVCVERGPSTTYMIYNNISVSDLSFCDGNTTNGFSCNITTYADEGTLLTFRWEEAPVTFTQRLQELPGPCLKAKTNTFTGEGVE